MRFDYIRDVSKDEFIAVLEQNEHEAEQFKDRDETAWRIIEHHKRSDGQLYTLINLHEDGLDNLILPHHHHAGFPSVGKNGDYFWNVVERYRAIVNRPAQDNQECVDKIRKLINTEVWMTSMTFVSNDPDFAVKGHYDRREGEYLYGTGFHRLVAFGVWMKMNDQYPPLEMFYCKVPLK